MVQRQKNQSPSHIEKLTAKRVSEARCAFAARHSTQADEQALYAKTPSFVDMLPWVEFLPDSQCMLLEDGESVAAFFELTPVGTEGREASWLKTVRDALENALQDSFDELEGQPWVVQLYAQDESDWANYLNKLKAYIQPRAQGTAFAEYYLQMFEQHLRAISKPGGLFEDTAVTKLPWRGQTRKVRLVVYRRSKSTSSRRGQCNEQALNSICDRLTAGLGNAGVKSCRMNEGSIHNWLLRWFNPNPRLLGNTPEARRTFYQLAALSENESCDELELASGTDFAQRLFFEQPRSDASQGIWYLDEMPHRVVVLDRLRSPPVTGHLTGETSKGGDATNALFDQMPEETTLCITLVITPQDMLEAHLNHLASKSVGDTLASEQTRDDVQRARSHIGSAHKLYRGAVAFYLRGENLEQLEERTLQLHNVMLNAGLQPVRDEHEVAPLNTYLRWLPCVFNPGMHNSEWYTQLMFAQHIANLAPVWGRSEGTGHPGITFFNRGGGTITIDPLNSLDRQMNAHLFLFGPTGAGKSATLNNILNQVTAVYRPRIFVVEAGNSFGLFADFAKGLGLTVNRVKLAPGSGVSLAPFADAHRLVDSPTRVKTLDAEELDDVEHTEDDERDVLGELEITARLMITGGEEKEEQRLTRADRSMIRHCIIAAATACSEQCRTVLTEDVRNALIASGGDINLPEQRRTRMLEMADAMDMFCQGSDGDLFNREGTAWPEADITIIDLATYAREGYNAQLSIAYISLINAVNNIAERDQMLGRPIINVTDEGHIIAKNPLLCSYALKIIKMWRKLGAWFWFATQNIDDLPRAAEPMLNMIEWWICLNMPPDEVNKIARFRELNEAQKKLMLSARKESGKFTEGVILSKSTEVLFRAVPPSLYLAMAMTEPEEKAERFRLMNEHDISELDAAIAMAKAIDRKRGIN
ncbi:conjugative transfer ATPase [Pseudomonas palleroniana]|uniref:Conjugal transfer protein n=1 Tax=Pseudomonas palleroniana TaxID=191390 RepID=A0A0X7JZH8_9PSED|nr:conjugative transfer ATPase [Pseudomonas palleroniana]KWU48834.1 conjugal transfer protein [Pseudomonas palleroniana]